jgi:hypothetical protein
MEGRAAVNDRSLRREASESEREPRLTFESGKRTSCWMTLASGLAPYCGLKPALASQSLAAWSISMRIFLLARSRCSISRSRISTTLIMSDRERARKMMVSSRRFWRAQIEVGNASVTRRCISEQ